MIVLPNDYRTKSILSSFLPSTPLLFPPPPLFFDKWGGVKMKMPETLIYLFTSLFLKTCFVIGMHPAILGVLD